MGTEDESATSCTLQIRDGLRSGVSIAEARIAMALQINPGLRGTRALEWAAGIGRALIRSTVPDEGRSSALLTCLSRGDSDFRESRPMQVVLNYQHEASRKKTLSITDKSSPEEGVVLLSDVVDLCVPTASGPAVEPAYGTQDAGSWLDPSLDIWSNAEQSSVGTKRAGDRGWALAVAYGSEPVEVPLAEIRQLWGLTPRGTSAALQRLEEAGWVSRTRRGLKVYVTIDFSGLLQGVEHGYYGYTDRAGQRIAYANHEGQRLQRRRTSRGLRAWLAVRGRAEKIRELPQGACSRWRALLSKRLAEEEIYDALGTPSQPWRPVPAKKPDSGIGLLAAFA